jgi:hypothetical protein
LPKLFPIGQELKGWASDGRALSIRIKGVKAKPVDFEGMLDIEMSPALTDPALFSTPSLRLNYEASVPVDLKSVEKSRLKRRAKQLLHRAYHERLAADYGSVKKRESKESSRFHLDEPVISTAGDRTVATVLFRGTETYNTGATDPRLSVFFIYDRRSSRILFAKFGHPEWEPDAKNVLQVEPLMFFSIEGNSRLYMLATISGPWEHAGSAIFDVHQGRVLTGFDWW